MAPTAVAVPNVMQDPGYLFYAPLGSTIPTMTVSGSKFTDAWPVAWVSFGATEEGSEFTYETKVEAVKAAEIFDPIKFATVERSGSLAFACMDWTLAQWKRLLNGGTLTVVSGTGATQLNSYEPPTPGNEVRAMLGWESLDNTARIIMYQCFQGGTIKAENKRPPATANLAATWNFEAPVGGIPFKIWTAGTARA